MEETAFFEGLMSGYAKVFFKMLPVLFIAVVTVIIAGILGKVTTRAVLRGLKNSRVEIVVRRFMARTAGIAVFIVGIAIALNILGLDGAAQGIITGAGFAAIITGFAFKETGENFVAGFMLAFSRPFDIGDEIETAGLKGKVVEIDLRRVKLKTAEGRDIFIPNSHVFRNPIIKSKSEKS
ncbi:MAG TPA: mechanosensitive ion channel [Firmicutes bacterium]|nr:mechanosensitive ion channel [Bacillota bacterium]